MLFCFSFFVWEQWDKNTLLTNSDYKTNRKEEAVTGDLKR